MSDFTTWPIDNPKATILLADVETTGLSPEKDHVLEVVMMLVEALTLVPIYIKQFVFPLDNARRAALMTADPWIWDTHSANGLIRDCARVSTTASAVWAEMDAFLFNAMAKHKLDKRDVILMGNSPHGVDIPFLHKSLPLVGQRIHHRVMDMTAAALLADIAGARIPTSMKHRPGSGNHRAMDDCFRCLEALSDWAMMSGDESEVAKARRAAFQIPDEKVMTELVRSLTDVRLLRAVVKQDEDMLLTNGDPNLRAELEALRESMTSETAAGLTLPSLYLLKVLGGIGKVDAIEAAHLVNRKEVADGDAQA